MALLPKAGGGSPLVYANASAGGDTFANSGHELLHVRNAGGAQITVTINSIKQCDQGFDHDETVDVPAGDDVLIGPLSAVRFNNASGQVAVSYSGTTNVTVAVIG